MTKFYDTAAVEATGGLVDVAALMAKEGIKTDDASSVTVPNIDTTVSAQSETKQEDARPAEPKTETAIATAPVEQAPVQPAKPETPAPVQSPPARPAEADWREVLKKQPEVEIMKAIGLDEKMINFLSRWRGGEDLREYLEAASTDYSKMSAEEIMRRYYRSEFQNVTPEDFEEIYRMKVIEQFKLDPDVFDEKDVRRGKLLLNYEADKIREQLAKRQQELLFAKPPEMGPSPDEALAMAEEEQRQQAVAQYRGTIEKDAFTQDLLNKRLMTVGSGEDAFNYEVSEPQSLLDIIFDPQKWGSKLYDANGAPNVRKHMLLAAIANDDTGFMENYAKHHQRVGAKKAIEPIENASTTIGTPSKGAELPTDPAAALARAGVITSG